ncbi:hypothetical protein ACJMK2_043969, partial [Sinanodonta woodiana]
MDLYVDRNGSHGKVHSATRRPTCNPRFGSGLESIVSLPLLVRSHTDVNGFRSKLGRSMSPTTNYMLINKRASKGTVLPVFRALNAAFKPIPRLFDPPTKEDFGRRDMKIWENEVK